ncbi:sperm-specific protein Don juan [Drosophila subpulchrella]|uniref:sperm-specific protein Don juan n=1 Tax=Drosophila subpulchrella TaxID=1486046 RepID=UPI0018A17B7C|nr:sperm-specific protein Don juan [Drosophila subpulchrella]
MFKRSALILSRCTHSSFFRTHHLKVLANIQNEDICNPDGLSSQRPKRFGDGSIGVIHVQEQESSELANPLQRHFLDDLERQRDQRIDLNRWLKEEKNVDFEKMKRESQKLVKEITMEGHDSDVKKVCKELAQKEKSEKEKIKQKCRELVAREKCEKDKLKKMCKELNKKDKGKKKDKCEKKDPCEEEDPCAEKDPCPKKDPCAEKPKKKDPCEKEDPCKKVDPCDVKKIDWDKKCMEIAKKEKCKKMAEKAKMKKMIKKCKKFAEKEKCRKLAEKEKCRKKAQKAQKSQKPQNDNSKKK